MKKLLLLLTLFASLRLCATPLRAAEDIINVSDLTAIQVQTNDIGTVNAGDVKSTLANYPALRAKLRTMLAAKLDAEVTLLANARIAKLAALQITLPQTVIDKLAARVEALRVQKEAALLTVKSTNPARALSKMNELIAAGLPITTATRTAVIAAQPTPTPTPTPVPEPNDGL